MLGSSSAKCALVKRATGTAVAHLAESIEDAVEEDEDVAAGHLGDVVHGLTRKVPHAGVRIGKAGQDGRHQLCQVGPDALEVLGRGDEGGDGGSPWVCRSVRWRCGGLAGVPGDCRFAAAVADLAQSKRHGGHGNQSALSAVGARIVKDKLLSQHRDHCHNL